MPEACLHPDPITGRSEKIPTSHLSAFEPYAEVPLREPWLDENADALESVRQGLRESAGGEGHDLGASAEPDRDDE